jgi:hypothetical protein
VYIAFISRTINPVELFGKDNKTKIAGGNKGSVKSYKSDGQNDIVILPLITKL